MSLVQAYGHGASDSTGQFNTTAISTTINTGQNFAGSNAVVVMVQYFGGLSEDVSSVTVAGTTCSRVISADETASNFSYIYWCATNAGGSDAVVITWTGAAGQKAGHASILEWSGVSGLDTGCENFADQTASLNPTVSTAIATTTTNTLLVAVSGSLATGADTYTAPSGGWTEIGKIESGAVYDAGETAYLVDTGSAGTKTATWTQGANIDSRNCIAAFILSSGPAPRIITPVVSVSMR